MSGPGRLSRNTNMHAYIGRGPVSIYGKWIDIQIANIYSSAYTSKKALGKSCRYHRQMDVYMQAQNAIILL